MGASRTTTDGRGRVHRYAPVALWIILIFIFSSSAGSFGNTSLFIRPLLHWLFPNTPEELLIIYHGYIRKGAHLFMYGSLAAIAWRAFIGSTKTELSKYPWLAALGLVAIVGSVDEFNQSYNLLRTGQPSDVLIDLCGGVVAMLCIYLTKHLRSVNQGNLGA